MKIEDGIFLIAVALIGVGYYKLMQSQREAQIVKTGYERGTQEAETSGGMVWL